MNARGFSTIELLVVFAICSLITGAIAAIVPPARAAFDQTPAVIDIQQRGRIAIDTIAQALRSAGSDVGAATALGPFANVVPAALVAEPDESGRRFSRLTSITPKPHAAQGMLLIDQAGGGGPLTLAVTSCPSVNDVCGFRAGTTAAIADGTGRFDLFAVASTHPGARRIMPSAPFTQPYAAGSIVVEVDAHTFRLETQPDGSRTLVRETGGGAVQPIVDGVSELSFAPFGGADDGALMRLNAGVLEDGPWWHGGPDGIYDDDQFRLRRVDIGVRLEAREAALRGAVPQQFFHAAITLRNAP